MSKWSCSKKDGLEVCLDIELTPELIAEGKRNDGKRKEAMERKKQDEKIKSECPYIWNKYFCLKDNPKYKIQNDCIPKRYARDNKIILCEHFKKSEQN